MQSSFWGLEPLFSAHWKLCARDITTLSAAQGWSFSLLHVDLMSWKLFTRGSRSTHTRWGVLGETLRLKNVKHSGSPVLHFRGRPVCAVEISGVLADKQERERFSSYTGTRICLCRQDLIRLLFTTCREQCFNWRSVKAHNLIVVTCRTSRESQVVFPSYLCFDTTKGDSFLARNVAEHDGGI